MCSVSCNVLRTEEMYPAMQVVFRDIEMYPAMCAVQKNGFLRNMITPVCKAMQCVQYSAMCYSVSCNVLRTEEMYPEMQFLNYRRQLDVKVTDNFFLSISAQSIEYFCFEPKVTDKLHCNFVAT